MSKVEMSLQEYDELKEELAIYEEIVNAITNPCIEGWDLEWYEEHSTSGLKVSTSSIMNNLSHSAKTLVSSLIATNVGRYMKDNHIKGDFKIEDTYFTMGYIHHNDDEIIINEE